MTPKLSNLSQNDRALQNVSDVELNNTFGGEEISWKQVAQGAWNFVSGVATADWLSGSEFSSREAPGTPPMQYTGEGRSNYYRR